jgi:predicted AlkP superfamily phosphohydrolase/phosphomutase
MAPMGTAYRKLLLLGLDAVPWRILGPMIDAGVMPCFRALRYAGWSGNLRSTIPHQTPSAWTTFMTGVQPGTHGILNWQHYDVQRNSFTMNDLTRFAGRTIYHLFSEAGLKVGVVMQPVTYPPFAVNGFLLSGFDSPGLNAPFAFPRELEKEVLEICPAHAENVSVDERWEASAHETDDAAFARNIAAMSAYVTRVGKLAVELYRRHPTDVLMVYFQAPDLVLHRAWRWCDPVTAGASPQRQALVREFFRTLDTVCGELVAVAGGPECLTLALSDHGQRPDALRVRLNSILMELGYLVPASGWRRIHSAVRRLKHLGQKAVHGGIGVAIDWSKTRAFMPYQSCTGFVYVNQEGRQPHGCVPAAECARVRDELVAALRQYRDPRTSAKYFAEVEPMDETHGWREKLALPDLYVQPQPGVEFVRRAKKGSIAFPTKRPYAGLHDPDGFYLLHGAGVQPRHDAPAHIADLAPTLLAALNVPVPAFMQGHALQVFAEPLRVEPRAMTWDPADSQETYTPDQAAAVEKRLADLGYLD